MLSEKRVSSARLFVKVVRASGDEAEDFDEGF